MERVSTERINGMDLISAKKIMRENIIGPDELREINGLDFEIPSIIPEVPFNDEELIEKKDDYVLILGLSKLRNGTPVNIRNMIRIFGKNPAISEPCFYNQDWYDNEDFIDFQLETGWYLIKKEVYEDSRAKQPEDLLATYDFPSAIKCVYAFFVGWESNGIKLWYHDFVWCSDTDHNGDRIYVGKYHDVDGINKNGFSIHRHLALRPCYGCID